MKKLLLIFLVLSIPSSANLKSKLKLRGLTIVHFNAKFNEPNDYPDSEKLKDVKLINIWIDDDKDIKESEGIRSVPTMILYNNGKEIKRWEAGITLKLDVPYIEIQKEVDKHTGADKF